MRENIGEFFIHLGWAFFGQECECGSNPFNGLARAIGPGTWSDENPKGLTRLTYWIGCRLVDLGAWVQQP